MNRDVLLKAENFAREKHKNQVRKYTGEPYFNHLQKVKDIVTEHFPDNLEAQITAYLHDTVEDTDTTIQEINEEFGYKIAENVFWLTDFKSPKEGNRKTRKLITNWKLWAASQNAKIVKLADMIDNTSDIVKNDPNFARVYLEEKRELFNTIIVSLRNSDFDYNYIELFEKAYANVVLG